MKLVIFSSVILLCISCQKTDPLQKLYRSAERAFVKENYDRALPLLMEFVEKSKGDQSYDDKLFGVIDQIGRIYIRKRQNPESAIDFLSKIKNDRRLSEADEDNISEWISAIREWHFNDTLPKELVKPDELYNKAKKYYEFGMASKKYPKDDKGNAYFHIAAPYLLKFIMNFDSDERIGSALFMMGHIRSFSWEDHDFWAPNFYLKEVIRRFPHTPLAMKAWHVLKDEVHFGYTGSSGDNTPESLKLMLSRLKHMADPENVKTTKKLLKNMKEFLNRKRGALKTDSIKKEQK